MMGAALSRQSCKFIVLPSLCGLMAVATVQAKAPILFQQAAYQSPVHAEPDDLLFIPGNGFAAGDTVVYELLDNTVGQKAHPETPPSESTAASGIAQVVSTLNIPHSLTIRLPEIISSNQSYALWVRNAAGEWSNGIKINDARPLWISPSFVFTTQNLASLPRYVKVIGRNLQPANDQITQIRLSGPQTMVLPATTDPSTSELDSYMAKAMLPTKLQPGTYQVSLSRDGKSWVAVSNQQLEVRADPPVKSVFTLDNPQFGGCHANDALDDAPCLQRAIAAATSAGGGIIELGKGTWDLIDSRNIHLIAGEGLHLPAGILLLGQGSALTTVIRHPQWNADDSHPAFTLEGKNEVSGIRFHDSQIYSKAMQAAPFLQLGRPYERLDSKVTDRAVSEVVITGNLFDKPGIAISDAGLPIKNLFVTYNEFGAYQEAVQLSGNRFNMTDPFRIDDSIIAFNHFYPGSYLDTPNRQGAIATELGAGFHLDFSNNNADGTNAEYLNAPEDAHGWRAGFFFHMNGNQEMLLVSSNTATCTGDKVGDGEAIAYDNTGNTFAFDTAKTVLKATRDSLTVSGPLLARQNDRDVHLASYYVGHWIQIGQGPGLGQVRKITAYSIDPASQQITFKIAPAWDITPVVDQSAISIGREFWQVYTVANRVDHRKPTCLKSNRSDSKGGGIALWAQTADSAVDGNQQFDTDGILYQTYYSDRSPACKDCYPATSYINAVEIRNNLIDGEYDWETDCSSSGIFGSLAAGPGTPPLTVNYGLSIEHNTITHADAWRGGAIAMMNSWYAGPAPHRWPLVDSALIYHNTISDLWSGRARTCRNQPASPRTGINLGSSSLVWHTLLYANKCEKIPQPTDLTGTQQTTKLCKTGMMNACECQK